MRVEDDDEEPEHAAVMSVLSDSLRDSRVRNGQTQEELAQAARDLGLAWSRSTVAAIENGERDLSVAEFLALPYVLDKPFRDLIPDEPGNVSLAGLVVPLRHVRSFLNRGTARLALKAKPVRSHQTDEELAEFTARGEAEQKAARALGIDATDLARTALRLWGHGLTDERERRLQERSTDDMTPRQQQAVRGHITRSLLDEIREEN